MKAEMVEIDDVAIKDFCLIHKRVYGESIGYTEGKIVATDFLGFVKFLLSKPNLGRQESENVYEKRIQETTTK